MPGMTLGDMVPNVEGESTHGHIRLHDYISGGWAVIFSHPADFTPVCTTELAKAAVYAPEFEKRGVKLLGISNDRVESHEAWIGDVEALTAGSSVTYPIMADPERKITEKLNMVDPDERDSSGRTLASRALHIVGPDKRIRLSFLYPGAVGRNFEEVLRVLDSLLLAAKHKIATPANWKPGERVVIHPSVTDMEAQKLFPQGIETLDLPSGKRYLRLTNVS